MCVHLQADPLCVGPPSVVASHPWHVERHVEHVARYHDDSDGEDDINGDNENDGGEDNDKKLLRELGFLTWIQAKRPFQTKFSLPEQRKLFCSCSFNSEWSANILMVVRLKTAFETRLCFVDTLLPSSASITYRFLCQPKDKQNSIFSNHHLAVWFGGAHILL